MGIVEYIHPGLATLDYTKYSTKVTVIACSIITYIGLSCISITIASLTQTYRDLRVKEKVFWHLAVVRAVFGMFCIVFGFWALFIDTELIKDVSLATSPSSYFALCAAVGFFLFECTVLLFSHIIFATSSYLLNLHHWLGLIGFIILMIYDSPHFFGCAGLILEMSTPFSAFCWTMLKCGKAHTLLWKANQFFLVHMFHCRSIVEIYFWYVTYMHWPRIWSAMPLPIFIMLYLQLTLVTVVMTPYWTYKKTAQMITPVDWNFEDNCKKFEYANGSVKKDH